MPCVSPDIHQSAVSHSVCPPPALNKTCRTPPGHRAQIEYDFPALLNYVILCSPHQKLVSESIVLFQSLLSFNKWHLTEGWFNKWSRYDYPEVLKATFWKSGNMRYVLDMTEEQKIIYML
jgi:hypothetical protein